MGAGLAKEAAIKFPGLALRYGAALERGSTRIVVPGCRLLLGPTKDDWRRPARKDLVVELLSAVAGWCDAHQSEAIAVPAIGCGNGGLQYREIRELALQRLARCRAGVLPPKNWPAGTGPPAGATGLVAQKELIGNGQHLPPPRLRAE